MFARSLATSLLALGVGLTGCDPDPAPPRPGFLARVDAEPAGANCKDGGQAIRSGDDVDLDGVLDDAEIEGTKYVCAEHGPENRYETASNSSEVPPGATCPNGGARVELGLDLDRDGSLDLAEVQSIVTVCRPELVAATLVRIDVEPAGASCIAGGAAVRTGKDADADGVLADTEILTTELICDGVIVGDYLADSREALSALEGIRVITGDLSFGPALIGRAGLPTLVHVGGSLVTDGAPELNNLSSASLESVGGDLIASKFDLSIELIGLRRVSGTVRADVASVDLPALEHVGGSLELTLEAQAQLELPELVTVARGITIDSQLLEGVALVKLVRAGGFTLVTENVPELELPELREIDGSFSLTGGLLTFFELPRLERVGEGLTISGHRQLLRFVAPELRQVGTSLRIAQNPHLPQCQVSAIVAQLLAAPADVQIGGNDDTATCD